MVHPHPYGAARYLSLTMSIRAGISSVICFGAINVVDMTECPRNIFSQGRVFTLSRGQHSSRIPVRIRPAARVFTDKSFIGGNEIKAVLRYNELESAWAARSH